MLFNSYEFIFVFLPLTLGGYVLLSRYGGGRAVIAFVFLASLVFYAYWSIQYLGLLLLSILINFWFSHRLVDGPDERRKRFLIAGIVFNLSLLAWFKYAGFVAENIVAFAGIPLMLPEIVLPIGISFYTFTQIAYLVDCHRDRHCETSLISYGLFVTIFPHLIAGPIIHHAEMLPQFRQISRLDALAERLSTGMSFFVIGLFKKVILADSVARYATPVFAAADAGTSLSTPEAWGGALAYTAQIYFDFSGYCDMAIGLGLMIGVRFPINFNSPYKSQSIVEFWRRWHMTLSRFLRDYLYIALGGNRHGRFRRYINLTLTMLLGGLWHGASWTFVIWGGLHGAYLVAAHALGARWTRALRVAGGESVARTVNLILTLLAVIVGWVFFRAGTFEGALEMLSAMFCVDGCSIPGSLAAAPDWVRAIVTVLGLDAERRAVLALGEWAIGVPLIAGVLLAALMLPNSQELMGYGGTDRPDSAVAPSRWRPSMRWALGLGVVGACCILNLSRVTEFLYFQF